MAILACSTCFVWSGRCVCAIFVRGGAAGRCCRSPLLPSTPTCAPRPPRFYHPLVYTPLCTSSQQQTGAQQQQQVVSPSAAGHQQPATAAQAAAAAAIAGNYSLDGSRMQLWPLIPTALPRLQQIMNEVIANASMKSGNRSMGQDTEAAAAAGYVVRRGTQFFKDGKPFYFIGGNVSSGGEGVGANGGGIGVCKGTAWAGRGACALAEVAIGKDARRQSCLSLACVPRCEILAYQPGCHAIAASLTRPQPSTWLVL